MKLIHPTNRNAKTSSFSNDRKITHNPSFSNDRKIGSRQATIFFIAFGNLPKASVDFTKARANLREIPEDASVRKPPLKEKARRQRTLTLENDELYSSSPNDRKITPILRHSRTVENREPTGDHIFFAFGNLPKASVDFTKARANLREIPEDASVRKPPLKEKARRQRTLTLENDELYSSSPNDRKITPILRHSRTVENREPTGDHIFFAFGNLPKATVDFGEDCANLREIPEDASVRKPPLKEKARRQRTLTLENDECIGIFTSSLYTNFPTHPIHQTK